MPSKKSHLLGAQLAAIHLGGFALTIAYIATSTSGQAVLVWVYWMVIDLPVSLLFFVGSYVHWAYGLYDAHPVLYQLLYPPHLIHGILGTIWWYLLGVILWTIIARLRRMDSRGKEPSNRS